VPAPGTLDPFHCDYLQTVLLLRGLPRDRQTVGDQLRPQHFEISAERRVGIAAHLEILQKRFLSQEPHQMGQCLVGPPPSALDLALGHSAHSDCGFGRNGLDAVSPGHSPALCPRAVPYPATREQRHHFPQIHQSAPGMVRRPEAADRVQGDHHFGDGHGPPTEWSSCSKFWDSTTRRGA